jgi:hypothetical protein
VIERDEIDRIAGFCRGNWRRIRMGCLTMVTDPLPVRGNRRKEYERSDALKVITVSADDRFNAPEIEAALCSESAASIRKACSAFLTEAARFYGVPPPKVRVLAARPLKVYETGSTELFGDYDLKTYVIRVWTRTAVRKQVTSFGTFFSTLCHEFCHHLDLHLFGIPSSPHTRGFYERAAMLYHHCRGTTLRNLVWRPFGRGRFRIDWGRMRRDA